MSTRGSTPDGPLWMAKDADRAKVQTIIANHPELTTRIAEVPVARFIRPLMVEDRSEGRRVDVSISYENSAGVPVEVEYRGRLPCTAPAKRNGHTMGHSAHAVAVALDLERFGTGEGPASQSVVNPSAWTGFSACTASGTSSSRPRAASP